MGVSEFLNSIKVSYTDELSGLEAKGQELKAKVSEVEENEAQYAADMAAKLEEGRLIGLEQAGQADGEGKIYTEEEKDQKVAEKVEPLNAEIASLNESVAALQAQIDAMPEQVEAVKAEAYKLGISDSLAIIEEDDAKETELESETKEKLKAKLV